MAKTITQYLVSSMLLLAGWYAFVFLLNIPDYLLPNPDKVLATLSSERSLFIEAAQFTVTNMLTGAFIGISAGIVVGFLVAYSRTARWIVEPYLVIFQSFPREALFPLFVVWLGFGAAPKILNAALLSFFPVAVTVLNALLDVRRDYVELIRSWGAGKRSEYLFCRLPYVVPAILSALKLALPFALIGAVLGEFMGGSEGLGYVIISSGSNFRVDRIFAAIVVLAVIGVSQLGFLQLLQNTVFKRYFYN